MYPTPSSPKSYLDEHAVADFSLAAYTKGNIALVADGVSQGTLSKWAGKFFDGVPAAQAGDLGLNLTSSTYYGGEQRSEHARGNAMVIAFPSSASAELAVLAALLGGPSSVKWSPGSSILGKTSSAGAVASATNLSYSDAGLLAIQISGSASAVRKTAEETVKALKAIASGSINKEDMTKAIAKARFDALEKSELRDASLLSVGTNIVHGQKLEAAQAVATDMASVTADKLQSVSLTDPQSSRNIKYEALLTPSPGRQDAVGWTGNRVDSWRSSRPTIRRGAWLEGIEGRNGEMATVPTNPRPREECPLCEFSS